MPVKSSAVAAAAAVTLISAAAIPAGASAPSPFPVYDSGSALVTAHHVTSGERLVIAGHPVTLGSVAHPAHSPAYVAHVLGVLPASWKGRTLAAVAEG